ncbi:MAG: FxLYD domain-containing protein [Verrucomicrobiae bacterium]|nr:FxLYD domain-containing protein [Verrucomicrobiae bacterium]
MKKVAVIASIIGGIFCVLLVAILSLSYVNSTSFGPLKEDEYSLEYITWLDTFSRGELVIRAEFTNVSKRRLKLVQIEYNVLDGNGRVIDTRVESIKNLNAGDVWTFVAAEVWMGPQDPNAAKDVKTGSVRGMFE